MRDSMQYFILHRVKSVGKLVATTPVEALSAQEAEKKFLTLIGKNHQVSSLKELEQKVTDSEFLIVEGV